MKGGCSHKMKKGSKNTGGHKKSQTRGKTSGRRRRR